MMKIRKLQRVLYMSALLVAAALFSFTRGAQATELHIDLQDEPVGVGGRLEVEVVLDTEGEAINAIETEVLFPAEILELVDIQTNNSVVNFWIEKESEGGKILLSGAIPGGFSSVVDPLGEGRTTSAPIVTLLFSAKAHGIDVLTFDNTRVLLHDGRGTPTGVTVTSHTFQVLDIAVGAEEGVITDTTPPEPFIVTVDKTSLLGKEGYYIFFATEDKGSGVDRYEIKEGDSAWVEGESPYYLKNQAPDAGVKVRAIDRSGNVRTATLGRDSVDLEEIEIRGVIRSVLFLGLLIGLLVGIKMLTRRKSSQ